MRRLLAPRMYLAPPTSDLARQDSHAGPGAHRTKWLTVLTAVRGCPPTLRRACAPGRAKFRACADPRRGQDGHHAGAGHDRRGDMRPPPHAAGLRTLLLSWHFVLSALHAALYVGPDCSCLTTRQLPPACQSSMSVPTSAAGERGATVRAYLPVLGVSLGLQEG